MKALVCGGSGFLGSHVCDELSDAGHEVSVFDIRPSEYLRSGQRMILGDILDPQAIGDAVAGQDVVYNFAGNADLDTASTDPRSTTMQNLVGSMNIIEACVESSTSQYVYASTIYVYSESGGFYRCSKQAAEIYLEEYSRKFGLVYTILRYGSLYGPRADERNPVYRYLHSALTDSEIHISGTGEEIREYIYVKDAANISAKVLEPKYYNNRYVITGHQAIPANRMIQMIEEILKKPIRVNRNPQNDPDHYTITPYSFVPKIGQKFAPVFFTDMGQGLIECLADIHQESLKTTAVSTE